MNEHQSLVSQPYSLTFSVICQCSESSDSYFSSFVASLAASNPVIIPGQDNYHYLQLAKQVGHIVEPYVLGMPAVGQRLFIRPCYDQLYDRIKIDRNNYIAEKSAKHAIIISGNAGIGKSVCNAHFMKKFQQDGVDVVYHMAEHNHFIHISPDTTKKCRLLFGQELATLLFDTKTVCLVELGAEPLTSLLAVPAFHILVASEQAARHNKLKDWQKR